MSQSGILKVTDSVIPTNVPIDFVTNSGTAVAALNILNVLGSGQVSTSGSGNTLTINVAQETFVTDSGTATAVAGSININGAGGTTTSASGNTIVINGSGGGGGGATTFVTNSGTAIEVAGVLNTLGTGSITISGSGNTTTASLTGLTNHSVLLGAGTSTLTSLANGTTGQVLTAVTGSDPIWQVSGNVNVQTGTSPIVPSAGAITINGSVVAAGTNPIRTDGTGASTMAIEVQKSQAIAAADATKIGLSNFDSAKFTVDATGFVSLLGTAVGQTITGTIGGALSPTAGNWNILGSTTSAGVTPINTSGSASTLTINLQRSQAIAVADSTKVGLSNFDSNIFTVDGNGFVSLKSTSVGLTITGTSGGALSPTANNWNILGGTVAAGTTPVATSGSVSTLTVNIQKSQAIAAADATKIGLCNFSSSSFAVDANGFVTLSGSTVGQTITGDTGGALSPTAGNWNIVGGSGISTSGSVSTITVNAKTGGFTWTDVSTPTQTIAVQNGYLTDRGAGVVYTLPATASIGDTFIIVGKLGLATITPNANQQILMSSASGTVGATGTAVSTNVGDSATFVCTTSGASTVWRASSFVGNWTLN